MKEKAIFLILSFALIICGCQKAPEDLAVVSKKNILAQQQTNDSNGINDGHLIEEEKIRVSLHDEFTSSDNSVDFTFNIDRSIPKKAFPIIEVAPHFLTGEEAKQIVHAVLGECEIYEQEFQEDPQYTKAEIQKKIQMMSPYATEEKFCQLMGFEKNANVSFNLDTFRKCIDNWTQKLENVPDGNFHKPCMWKFRSDKEYYSFAEGIDQLIVGRCNINDYNYVVLTKYRDSDDFQLSGLSIAIGFDAYEKNIYNAQLCRTDKPTKQEIDAVVQKTEKMLSEMNLGNWSVVKARIETKNVGETPEYQIVIGAAPVFQNISTLPGQPITSKDHAYGPYYYMTGVVFRFSPNGTLMEFGMESPVEIVNVVSEDSKLLTIDELKERAQRQLSYYDKFTIYNGFFGDNVKTYEENIGEELICKAEINDFQLGLGRIKVPETKNHYYILPVFSCVGSVEYYGKNSGKLYMGSHEVENIGMATQDLVWINAIDGTVIQ